MSSPHTSGLAALLLAGSTLMASCGRGPERSEPTAAHSGEAEETADDAEQPPIEAAPTASVEAVVPASLEQRQEICSRVIARGRARCASDKKVEERLTSICEAHPIWECEGVSPAELERCWMPADGKDRVAFGACDAWKKKVIACDVENTIRKQCPGILDRVLENTPAAKAGLRAGDKIESIDGVPFSVLDDLSTRVRRAEGRALRLHIDRAGKKLDLEVTPRKDNDGVLRLGVVAGYAATCPLIPTEDLLSCRPPPPEKPR